MLLIGLCSMLSGGRTFKDIEDFGLVQEDWLKLFLKLPGGIPSHDTFNRLFASLDTHAFEQSQREWSAGLGPRSLGHLLGHGRKTQRGEAGRRWAMRCVWSRDSSWRSGRCPRRVPRLFMPALCSKD